MTGHHDTPNNGSQKNNKLAFEESMRALTSLYEGGWCDKQEVVVDDALHLTLTVSSTIWLSAAGDSDRSPRRLSLQFPPPPSDVG